MIVFDEIFVLAFVLPFTAIGQAYYMSHVIA